MPCALWRPPDLLRDREDLDHPESPLHLVMLGNGDIITEGEAVPIETEDRLLLFLIAHVVVMERPMVAAMMDEVAVRVVLAGPEPMYDAGAPLRVPALRIEVASSVSGATNS
jgi:hypothetical protein